MKTMSDFIMEQEISNTSVDNDLQIMEGFMKVQAIGAVAECYCEHAAIADFAKEAGLNVFSESDDSLGKKMLDGVKTFFETMWRWIKALVKGVINIFTKSSLEKCIAELKAAQRDGKNTITDLDVRYLDAEKVLELVEKFGDTIQKGTALTSDTLESDFTKPAEEWLKGFKEPMALMLPLNILELVIKPLSLCMRLFGNVLGAFVVMELIKMVLPVGLPLVFSFYFDIM